MTDAAIIHKPTEVASVVLEFRAELEQQQESGERSSGVKTGIFILDEATKGLKRGSLTVLGARPGMGKSMLALSIATGAAMCGFRTLVFSTQHSNIEVARRLTSASSSIELRALRDGRLSDSEWQRADDSMRELAKLPLSMCDTRKNGIEHVVSQTRLTHGDQRGDLIVVDGLQELLPSNQSQRKEDRTEMVDTIRRLKQLALERDASVVLTSQLRRSPDVRRDHRPILSDLRHFKHIQHHLDSVWLLYRECYYDHRPLDHNLAEIHIPAGLNENPCMFTLEAETEFSRFRSPYSNYDSFE